MLRNNKTEVKSRFTLGLVVLSSVRSASDLSTTSEWKPWGYMKVLQPCVHVGFSPVRLLSDFWPGDKDNKVINLYSFKLLNLWNLLWQQWKNEYIMYILLNICSLFFLPFLCKMGSYYTHFLASCFSFSTISYKILSLDVIIFNSYLIVFPWCSCSNIY